MNLRLALLALLAAAPAAAAAPAGAPDATARRGPVDTAGGAEPRAADGAEPHAADAPPPREEPSWLGVRTRWPELAERLDARGPDADRRAAAAEVLYEADPRLVALLLPAPTEGPLRDLTGEAKGVDLVEADVWLDGTVLRGSVAGPGVAANGAWLDVDLAGGPAPDLRLGFGRGWMRATPLDGGASPPLGPLPTVGTDRVDFTYDLALTGRGGRGYAGAAVALVKSADGRFEDPGPAGTLGPLPDEAVDVLLALLDAGPVRDADLAVALAVTFGALRTLVADDVVPTVDADAVAWLRYGEALDAWLAASGAEWRFGELDALGKLVWAWPATQNVVYGAAPLLGQATALDAARWRFAVPDVATLTRLRALAPLSPKVVTTAKDVDDRINREMRYRTHDALMEPLCRAGTRTKEECEGWVADRRAGRTLGELGATPVHLWQGTSATWQLGVRGRENVWVGDCATATALAISTLQALGIPAIGMGWSGADLGTPTHDVPLWYDGATFRATQRGPGPSWTASRAFVYVTLPAVHPVQAFTGAHEPGAWTRGGAVAGGWTTYGELTRTLRDGLPGATVGRWIDVAAQGGWPGL